MQAADWQGEVAAAEKSFKKFLTFVVKAVEYTGSTTAKQENAAALFNSKAKIICVGAPPRAGGRQARWHGAILPRRGAGRNKISPLITKRHSQIELESLIMAQIERWRYA